MKATNLRRVACARSVSVRAQCDDAKTYSMEDLRHPNENIVTKKLRKVACAKRHAKLDDLNFRVFV